jgi:hypothetical protein
MSVHCASAAPKRVVGAAAITMWAPDGRVLAVARQTRLAGA